MEPGRARSPPRLIGLAHYGQGRGQAAAEIGGCGLGAGLIGGPFPCSMLLIIPDSLVLGIELRHSPGRRRRQPSDRPRSGSRQPCSRTPDGRPLQAPRTSRPLRTPPRSRPAPVETGVVARLHLGADDVGLFSGDFATSHGLPQDLIHVLGSRSPHRPGPWRRPSPWGRRL